MRERLTWLRRVLRWIGTALVGHDVFVSYARVDGSGYARALAAGLEDANLWTFVDYEAIPPGEQLRMALDRGIRRSRLLVVVCSAGAVASKWVGLEVERFPKAKRSIVPINIDGQFQKAPWQLDSLELVWVDETAAALASATPTPGVIESILKQVTHRRRRVLALQIAGAVLFALGFTAAAAVANWRQLAAQRETTLAQRLVSLAQGDFQAHPANLETPALVLLESARRRPTPEAADALLGVLRLIRTNSARAQLGRIVQQIELSPDGGALLASGMNAGSTTFIAVLEPGTLAVRWRREFASNDLLATWASGGAEVVVATRSEGVLVFSAGEGALRHEVAGERRVSAVTASRDGRWLATGSDTGIVTLWDAGRWANAGTAQAGRNVLALQFNPAGDQLAASGGLDYNGTSAVFVWRTANGLTESQQVPVPHLVSVTNFSDDGRWLAATGGSRASVFDAATMALRVVMSSGGSVNAFAFDRTGSYAAMACTDRTARVYRLSDGLEAGLYSHRDNVTSVSFHPNGESVVTGSSDGTLRVWGMPPQSGTAEIFNADREEARLGHGGSVSAFVVDKDGARVTTASYDGSVRAWSLMPDPQFRFSKTEGVLALAPSPDGASVASAGLNYSPGIWPLSGFGRVRRLPPHGNDLTGAAFDDDDSLLAVADSDATIRVYAGPDYKRVSSIPVRASVAFAGGLVAGAGRGGLTLWNPRTGAQLQSIPWAESLSALAGRRRYLAAGDAKGTILLFDVGTQNAIERRRWTHAAPIRALAFDGAGRTLAAADGGGTIHLWQAASGRLIRSFTTGDEVAALALDETGEFLAVGSVSGSVSVWRVHGEEVSRFTHGTRVGTVAFSQTGPQMLFYGGYGGFAFTPWRLDDLVARTCATLSRRTLSEGEWHRFVGEDAVVSNCTR